MTSDELRDPHFGRFHTIQPGGRWEQSRVPMEPSVAPNDARTGWYLSASIVTLKMWPSPTLAIKIITPVRVALPRKFRQHPISQAPSFNSHRFYTHLTEHVYFRLDSKHSIGLRIHSLRCIRFRIDTSCSETPTEQRADGSGHVRRLACTIRAISRSPFVIVVMTFRR
jgi:hypothetical protein